MKGAFFKIGDTEFDNSDFEEIKKIICEYNDVEMIDDTISKEVRDKMEETIRLKQKDSGNKSASLEDLMVCITIETPYKLEDVYNLSIRKFGKLLERINRRIDYQILNTAAYSGFVSFKDQSILKHWMSEFPKDKYKGTMMDTKEIDNKVNEVNFNKKNVSNFE